MKKLSDYDFYEIGCAEAMAIGPFGPDDYPVTVECYRDRKQWKSCKAAKAFYTAGSNCCMGSEAERYATIVSKLECGKREVNDNPWEQA